MGFSILERRSILSSALVLLTGIGCAGSEEDTQSEDGHLEAPSGGFPAFSFRLPQIKNQGGRILAKPTFVPITFDGDPLRDDIEKFTGNLAQSKYWKTIGADYGVTDAAAGAPVHVATPPGDVVKASAVESWLANMLDGTHPEFGAPDAQSVYTIFYPPGTSIDGLAGSAEGASCVDYGAYHGSVMVGSTAVVYVASPRCEQMGGLKGLDFVTFTTSHELIEAATDPFADTPAFSGVDDWLWEDLLNTEVGDLCARLQQPFKPAPSDVGFAVQRIWSNSAAKAGHDPCIPSPAKAYFTAVPDLPDTTPVDALTAVDEDSGSDVDGAPSGTGPSGDPGDSPPATVKTITVPLNGQKTIDVRLSSDRATTGPWTVQALLPAGDPKAPPTLGMKFDQKSGTNGDVLKVTITGKVKGSHAFVLRSALGDDANMWPGMVIVR
jgi:hypothetical protein